ncbi:MAG: hypothetical protein P1S46_07640 [bacterium]|nr:hypothetical protein [bacterium]
MRWTTWSGTARYWPFIAVLIVGTGAADMAMALDVSLTGRADYTASDNIERASAGSEISGTILTQTVGLEITEPWGPKTLDLLIEGGWETVEAATLNNEEISRFRLGAHLPWSSTGAADLSIETSRETVPPDPDELNQGRLLTDRSLAVINLVSRNSPISGWEIGLSARTEEREDRDLKESVSVLTMSTAIDRTHSIEWIVGLTDGEDAALGNSWVEDEASIALNRRLSASSSMVYRLRWDGSRIEEADTGIERSQRIGAGVTYRWQSSSQWQQEYGVFIDQVTTGNDERFTEPGVQVAVGGDLTREARLTVSANFETRLPDPLSDQVTWSKNATLQTGVAWTAARNLSVEPVVFYRRTELFGDETVDRDDVTTSCQVSMIWQPGPRWSAGLTALSEVRNSSDEAYDLSENRIGINLSGTMD